MKRLQRGRLGLLIVLLEVAEVDGLKLLDLIHILKSYSATRKDLLDHKGATPVRSEFPSTVRQVNGTQNKVPCLESPWPSLLQV